MFTAGVSAAPSLQTGSESENMLVVGVRDRKLIDGWEEAGMSLMTQQNIAEEPTATASR